MDATPEQVDAGHAFYTRRSLAVYDLAILGYFSRLAWRCPAHRIVTHYDRHVSANHLDVGVGTGYFLDHCRFPGIDAGKPRLALMDISTSCLDAASERVARFDPEIIEANVLEPIAYDGPRFESVGLNYLLHCLPGDIRSKAVVFDHLKAMANPGAWIFGATLLQDGVHRNWFARQVMSRNNAHGIFSNAGDSLDGLQSVVSDRLEEASIEVVGCVGIFAGRA